MLVVSWRGRRAVGAGPTHIQLEGYWRDFCGACLDGTERTARARVDRRHRGTLETEAPLEQFLKATTHARARTHVALAATIRARLCHDGRAGYIAGLRRLTTDRKERLTTELIR